MDSENVAIPQKNHFVCRQVCERFGLITILQLRSFSTVVEIIFASPFGGCTCLAAHAPSGPNKRQLMLQQAPFCRNAVALNLHGFYPLYSPPLPSRKDTSTARVDDVCHAWAYTTSTVAVTPLGVE